MSEAVVAGKSDVFLRRVCDGLSAILLLVTGFIIIFCFGDMKYYPENALLESMQNLYLFAGALLFLFAMPRHEERAHRLMLLALSLFCLTVFIREVEVKGTIFAPLFEEAFENRADYITVGIGWLVVLAFSFRYRELWRAIPRGMKSIAGYALMAGIVLYMLGTGAEENLFSSEYQMSEMIEESLELLGAYAFMLSGFVVLRERGYMNRISPIHV